MSTTVPRQKGISYPPVTLPVQELHPKAASHGLFDGHHSAL